MLTLLTQTAIAVSYDTVNSGVPGRSEQTARLPDTFPDIPLKLVSCGPVCPCAAAGKSGAGNQLTRRYLSEIKQVNL